MLSWERRLVFRKASCSFRRPRQLTAFCNSSYTDSDTFFLACTPTHRNTETHTHTHREKEKGGGREEERERKRNIILKQNTS